MGIYECDDEGGGRLGGWGLVRDCGCIEMVMEVMMMAMDLLTVRLWRRCCACNGDLRGACRRVL